MSRESFFQQKRKLPSILVILRFLLLYVVIAIICSVVCFVIIYVAAVSDLDPIDRRSAQVGGIILWIFIPDSVVIGFGAAIPVTLLGNYILFQLIWKPKPKPEHPDPNQYVLDHMVDIDSSDH
ncbi:MAG: hypothetical protein IT324_25465 [Anaerolineae bacterium]|nr:hypothetical protein [Anaerolineae bacterium]